MNTENIVKAPARALWRTEQDHRRYPDEAYAYRPRSEGVCGADRRPSGLELMA